MALGGSLMCGLRWTLCQLVMQRSELGLENPIDLMYHIQPLMIVSLLPLAIGIEGITNRLLFNLTKHKNNMIYSDVVIQEENGKSSIIFLCIFS